MNSTMPKSGQAPTSPNAMPGGLGAILQQPGGAPKGATSRSIQSVLDTARKMSDMQLADVLAGKSLDVPQYVAMTEAMGRKSLRTAMQGAQAQQQMRQPSVKDKLLAEEAAAQMPAVDTMGNVTGYAGGGAIDMNESAGIAGLPASNMDDMNMASGGIVAFSGADGDQEVKDEGYDPWAVSAPKLSGFDKKLWNAIKEKVGEWNQPWGKSVNATPEQIQGLRGGRLPAGAIAAEQAKSNTPTFTNTPTQAEIDAIRATNVPTGGVQFDHTAGGTYNPGGAGAAPKKSGIAALTEEAPKTPAREDYLAKLAGLSDKTREGIAGLKNEAQSQILLDAMSALMGSRNLAEAGGKAGTLFAGRVGAMNKEKRALEKEANDYDLNLARYREAVESGDQDRALQAKKMMMEHQARMAALGQEPDTLRTLRAIAGNPQLEALYNKTGKSEVLSVKDAEALWQKAMDDRKTRQAYEAEGIRSATDLYNRRNGIVPTYKADQVGGAIRPA